MGKIDKTNDSVIRELNDRLEKFDSISKRVQNESDYRGESAQALATVANAEARIIAALIEKANTVY